MKFNSEMLILAREARGLSQEELAVQLGIRQGTLSKIETGNADVSEYFNKICSILDFPPSFFAQQGDRFEISAHHYRKRISIPKKDLSKAKAKINIIKYNIEKLLISVEVGECNLPKWDVSRNGSPSLYAKYLREYWRLPKGKIDNLTSIVESNGIIVIHADFGTSKLDGLSIYTKDNQAIVFLNKLFTGDRMRLTLAHEIGHLGMHFSQIIDKDREVENEAYEFASELLIPGSEIAPHVSRLNLEKLADLKRYWKVSMGAIIYKCEKSGFITSNSARYLWAQYRKLGYHIQEPIAIEALVERTSLVREIFDCFLNDLEYSKSELADLLCLNLTDLEDYYFQSKPRFKVLRS